jgi:tetratricopeptide (TPR) repeat protein
VSRAVPRQAGRRSAPRAADLALPVLRATKIRRSQSGRRRAAVLIGVHVLVAIHIGHWLATGSTVSPLEPSESMEFSKHSIINAGLVFFGLSILSTLVLGRWFCGWACHLVALQDGSRWILGKLGLRPRPGRLGILGAVPLIAFAYMFLAPVVYRLLHDHHLAVPAGGIQLTTGSFWATFPSWFPAVLTLVACGFFAVYFLGSKGFCTYGCPYGAIFGVADQLAPARIRVTDACTGSGHCTGVCSSNVRVHEEVRDWGMVVDPGCMKCLDCVSVCPNDALYWGWGRPAILARRRTPRRDRRRSPRGLAAGVAAWGLLGAFCVGAYGLFMWFDGELDWRITGILSAGTLVVSVLFAGRSRRLREYTLPEQALLGAVFLAAVFVFRGLYGLVPFLFALGLAGIVAFLAVHALRLAYRRDLALHGWRLRRGGRMQPAGWAFAAVTAAALAFSAHSAAVQYHTRLGRRFVETAARLSATDPQRLAGLRGAPAGWAIAHLERGYALSLLKDPGDLRRIARLHLLEGRIDLLEATLRRAVDEAPRDAGSPRELGDLYASEGRLDEAIELFRESARRDPAQVEAYAGLARTLLGMGRTDEARAAFEKALANDPDQPLVLFDLGVLEASVGRAEEATALFERAVRLRPDYLAARENLAGMYCMTGRYQEGIAQFNEALRQDPGDATTHELIARAYLALGQWASAETHLLRAIDLEPNRVSALALLETAAELRGDPGALTVEQEVAQNILNQVVGDATLECLGLPADFLRRAADRVIRESFRDRHRRVVPVEPGAAQAPAPPPVRAVPGAVRVHRHDLPQEIRSCRAMIVEERPALRGFRAPIFEHASDPAPTTTPRDAAPPLALAARQVAQRLAADGLLATLVHALQILGPDLVLAEEHGGAALLRSAGLPVDLLSFFEVGGASGDPVAVIRSVARRLAAGDGAEALAGELRGAPFRFRPTRPDFRASSDSGDEDPGLVRLQLTAVDSWRGPGAGGCLDVARQLLSALPETDFVASIEARDLQGFLRLAEGWPLRRPGQLTVIPQPGAVSQWTADNGKPGLVGSGPSRRPATIVPRYASRREDGSVFVPGESFLMDGLASTGHVVVHSPLLFQGGNLLLVRDPAAATGARLLLVGEAEIYRNVSLGLSHRQALDAFAAELGADRCAVLPAVSFHIDYDLTARAEGGRVLAFVNDEDAAVRIVLELGLEALRSAGVLDEAAAQAARSSMRERRDAAFLEIVEPALRGAAEASGAFPLPLAEHFAAGPLDSAAAGLQRFLVALDILAAAALPEDRWPTDRHARSYCASFLRRRDDRALLHDRLSSLGFQVVPVPSLADEAYSLTSVNGIQLPDRYLMPAYGGFYAPLDDAAAAAFREHLGETVRVVPILCAESQRRVGAVHCSAAVYPRP